jgi:hypothetical protein
VGGGLIRAPGNGDDARTKVPRLQPLLRQWDLRATRRGCLLPKEANRPRADGAAAPPASGPVERVVRARSSHVFYKATHCSTT